MIPFIWKPQDTRNPAIERGYHIMQAYFVRIAGLYPDLRSGYRYWLFGAYVNFLSAAYPYYILAYIVSTAYAVKYRDVQLIGETLCYSSYTYAYFVVYCTFLTHRADIDKILEVAGKGVFTYERPWTPEELEIQEIEIVKTKNYGRYGFAVPVMVGFTQMAIIPAIRGFRGQYTSITNGSAPINKYSPLPVWTPYEATDGISFIVAYFCQMLPGMMEFFIMHGSCAFFVGCCSVLLSNLKLLHHSLDTITDRAEYLYAARGGKIEERRKPFGRRAFQECMVDSLKENIKHHVKIVEFFKQCQNVNGWTTLAIFLGAVVNVGTPPYTIVQVATMGEPEKVYTLGTVMLGHTALMLLLLSRYCLYGQDVMTESNQVLQSFYGTPWPYCDTKYRKLVVIAMSNSLKTISLRAYVIGTAMSAATLMDTIKKGYSLFNLLITTS